ncbi:hypothetical protein SK3146_00506 [Paenibacillus konkukensis]|uniref:Uncharacterized protein n=1 Tax=Paenibacillus konkukensis TaxID=2020716 RepID=A0ABY4RH47_9BACL|nr:hypothetical protein SK3146_00506 [Paenibacillus konkukensis]
MNPCRRLAITVCALIAVSGIYESTSMAVARAEETPEQPLLTIIRDTPFYREAEEAAPAGMLGGVQTLRVKETAHESTGNWYKVDTWLGEQWIPQSSAVIEGEVKSVDMKAHTLRVQAMYPAPYASGDASEPIAPQEIHITGKIDNDWYRIDTAAGTPKWLYRPLLLENIKEDPADYDMLLTRQEQLYEIPYLQTAPMTLSPQIVHVLAEWRTGMSGYRHSEIVWYRIRTDQGPRWVLPSEEKIGIRKESQSLTLPTGGYGYRAPETDDSAVWFEPGTVLEASASYGGWFEVKNGTADTVWINPQLSLQRRPLGTEPANVTLRLTGDTAVYRYPGTGGIVHNKGYYAPQEVQSIAKWSGDDQLDWYLFRGMDGDLWVPQPVNPSDRSLVGSWTYYRQGANGGMHGEPFDLTLTRSTYLYSFEPEEAVPLRLSLRNTSEQVLSWPVPLQLQVQIVRLNGDPEEAVLRPEQQEVVWSRKLPALSAPLPNRTDNETIDIEWDQKDRSGQPAAPGKYAARIVPAPAAYRLGEQDNMKVMTQEEMRAVSGEPVVFTLLPGM